MKKKFVAGGLVIAAALGYLVYAGLTQSAVYFVTPSELAAAPVPGRAYRLGGLVARGTLEWHPSTLDLRFALTDGQSTVLVRHHGTPPDLFAEGRGAVVEGAWTAEGYFRARQIFAKHSEEYQVPSEAQRAGWQELLRTLRGDAR
jgi:cytochrome c-type biogenesis protein CcmE